MKIRKYILFAVAAGMFAACDPIKDEADFDVTNVTAEQLLEGATFAQYSGVKNDDGTITYTPSETGNYIEFNIPSVSSVDVYYLKNDGSEQSLSTGKSGGIINYVPTRGSDANQTLYFRYINQDGEEVVASKEFTLEVAADLTPEMRIAVSDSGSKIWTWNKDGNGVWGNMGYKAGDFVNDFTGKWWGAETPDVLGTTDQLKHIPDRVAHGDEDNDAYMVFSEDGTIQTCKGDGTVIREGTFSIENYTGEPDADGWSYGTLVTSEEAILFPWNINTGEYDVNGVHSIVKPTNFEILRLTIDEMVLCVPPDNNAAWSEAAFWRFSSTSDAEGLLTNYDSKEWKWNTDGNGVWGNMGYQAGNFADNFDGKWWGAETPDILGTDDQLKHVPDHVAHGDEDNDAYMVWSYDGKTIQTYGNGSLIRSGIYNLDNYSTKIDGWSVGTIETTEESILFPWNINTGEYDVNGVHSIVKPTKFEVLKLTASELVLCVPPDNNAAWSEAAFWRFVAK